MELVINPRGTGGAGKTWLVREVMSTSRRAGAEAVPLLREGRLRPIGWRLVHPARGRPLADIGHYEATRGGTDTIPRTDGGLDEAFRLADTLAAEEYDVLMEGCELSGEVERTVALGRAQQTRGQRRHVIWIDVPPERCIRNVVARRRAGRDAVPAIERTVQAGHAALLAASRALQEAGVDVRNGSTPWPRSTTRSRYSVFSQVRFSRQEPAWAPVPWPDAKRAAGCQGHGV